MNNITVIRYSNVYNGHKMYECICNGCGKKSFKNSSQIKKDKLCISCTKKGKKPNNALPTSQGAINAWYDNIVRNHKSHKFVMDNIIPKKLAFEIGQKNCFYCGLPPKILTSYKYKKHNGTIKVHGLDRLKNGLGYIKDNCVPCCVTCNHMKYTILLEDFYTYLVNNYISRKLDFDIKIPKLTKYQSHSLNYIRKQHYLLPFKKRHPNLKCDIIESLDSFINIVRQRCYYCGIFGYKSTGTKMVEKNQVLRYVHNNRKVPSCGKEFVYYNGIDRIDNSKGYVTDNVLTACTICNYGKRGVAHTKELSVKQMLVHLNQLAQNFPFFKKQYELCLNKQED